VNYPYNTVDHINQTRAAESW